jgi:hypothetical protein
MLQVISRTGRLVPHDRVRDISITIALMSSDAQRLTC